MTQRAENAEKKRYKETVNARLETSKSSAHESEASGLSQKKKWQARIGRA